MFNKISFFLILIFNLLTITLSFIYFWSKTLKLAINYHQLLAKDKELANLEKNLDTGVIIYDQNFKIISFNKAAEKIFNLKAEEITGQIITPQNLKDPNLRFLTQIIFPSLAPVVKSLSEPNQWPQINEIEIDEPSFKSFKTILNKIFDEKGNLLGFIKIIKDQTREKLLLQAKSEFISVAAHQIRTPLTAISWCFEFLLDQIKDLEQIKIIKDGYETTQRALKTVNDLLDVAKIEEGKYDYEFIETEINQFLKTVIDQFKTLAQQYQVNLYFKPLNEELKINIDPQKFGIAVANLIDNAIRYNLKNGEVEVELKKNLSNNSLQIKIKDTGIGIPKKNFDKIFDKFYRAENAIKIEPNGSGLGLYITKNIIENHNGKIIFESIENRGTTFYISLPLTPK